MRLLVLCTHRGPIPVSARWLGNDAVPVGGRGSIGRYDQRCPVSRGRYEKGASEVESGRGAVFRAMARGEHARG